MSKYLIPIDLVGTEGKKGKEVLKDKLFRRGSKKFVVQK